MNGYDVVVVGGRVAGASTALLLTRAGAQVVLIDRDITPRIILPPSPSPPFFPVTVGADGIRSTVARQVAAGLTQRGVNTSAFLYRYFDQLPAAGYEWAYGDHSAAGLIPTNDATCAFVGTTPAKLRSVRRAGLSRRLASYSHRQLRPLSNGWQLPPRRARCVAGAEHLGTSAGVGDLAGRWSATPATSKTRSPARHDRRATRRRTVCRSSARLALRLRNPPPSPRTNACEIGSPAT